jgi:hypothetical protein
MALSSSTAFRQLSDGNTVGTVLGKSPTDLIGFYGVSSAVAQTTITGASMSSGALASSLAFILNAMGLINTTNFPG